MEGLMELWRLVVMVVVTVGPVVGLALLLNRRDRRRARLLGAVASEVGSPDLRGRVGLEVRCGVLSLGCRVAVHMLASSGEEVLDVLARLSRSLSPRVRLVVDGSVGGDRWTAFAFEARGSSTQGRGRK